LNEMQPPLDCATASTDSVAAIRVDINNVGEKGSMSLAKTTSRRELIAGSLAVGASLAGVNRSFAQANDDWQAGAPEEWGRVLAAARQEGQVAVAGFPLLSEKMGAAFKRDTGIQLNFVGGNTAEQTGRLEAEARAKNVTIDIVLSGGRELIIMRENLLEPVLPQLILPGVAPKYFQDGKYKFEDNAGQYLLQGSSFVFGWLVVNTDVVKPGEIKTWKDLLDPKFRSKIASYDVRFPGPGQGSAAWLYKTLGVEFIKDLFVGQQVRFSLDNRALMEGVVRGTAPILLGGIQFEVERFRSRFTNVEVVLPEDAPGYVTGGFSILKQARGVPHPNAAKVFINWYMSKPGQELYESVMMEVSRRIDIETGVPKYLVPRKGYGYVDDSKEDYFFTVRAGLIKKVDEALGPR
jgi:ABC-type Fe3+ transport system substrate-binding protein